MKIIYLVFSDENGFESAWDREIDAIEKVHDIIMAEYSQKEIEAHLDYCGYKGYDEDEHDFSFYFSDIVWYRAEELRGYN